MPKIQAVKVVSLAMNHSVNLTQTCRALQYHLNPYSLSHPAKALSGRVLVAAYWLFIVLMLATFTANLAAFLTVERMQTTVQVDMSYMNTG